MNAISVVVEVLHQAEKARRNAGRTGKLQNE